MPDTPSSRPDAARRLAAELASAPRPLLLRPAVMRYAWGGSRFIPDLLGLESPAGIPHAELWVGSYGGASSEVDAGGVRVSLADLIAEDAAAVVGSEAASRFGGSLPFLLKVLDVRSMLSIQAHPDSRQAAEGFAREERLGIPRDAPHRSYRDPHHKPEASVALTDVWLLHGFRPPAAIEQARRAVPELAAILPGPDVRGARDDLERARWFLSELYRDVMTAGQDAVDRALGPLVDRLSPAYAAGKLDRSDPGFWLVRAARSFPLPGGGFDRGLVSIYLLNLVRLRPGEGVFIPAGVLHAYLEGTAIEVMSASDNVLRGGLTPKHVDVAELLRVLCFDAGPPRPMERIERVEGERVYRTPAEEFEICRLELRPGRVSRRGPVRGADALLVLEGEAALGSGAGDLTLARGSAVLAPHGLRYSLSSAAGAVVFRASIPGSE